MPTIKDWGKGVNRDQLSCELAPGFWSAVQNMRFRAGRAERVGGIAQVFNTPSVTPYWLCAYPSGATRYLIIAGLAKVFADDGTTSTEITRSVAAAITPKSISSIVRTSNVITVTTSTAHGMSTAFVIKLTGKNLGDMASDATGAAITVTGATTFTFADTGADHAASSNERRGAAYTIITGGGTTDFTGGVDDKITGGNFNGVVIYNNPVDGLFYWDQADTGKLHAFSGTTYKSDIARPYKYFIVQLAPTVGGVKQRHGFYWSASAVAGSVPTEFTATATNDAGGFDIVSDGEMVDCLGWGDYCIVYKRDLRAVVSFIGGNDVFDQHRISHYSMDDGLLAPNCVVNTPKGQVFLSNNKDIRIHQGGESESIGEGRMTEYLRANMSTTYYARSFLTVNPTKKEVWICYPETGQSTCTHAIIWNWDTDAWGERDLSGVTFGCAGLLPTTVSADSRMVISTTAPKIGLIDSGTTDFGVAYTSTLERTGMDFDTRSYKTLHASMPIFDGASNFTASIFHGASAKQDVAPTYASAQTYTHNTTERITAFSISGRYLAWKMTTTASDTPALRSIDFADGINVDGTD